MNNIFEDPNNPDIADKATTRGYRLKRVEELSEINSLFYELEHIRTGARHIHISNEDKENTFSVAFKTVPTDSTGVAHILEHTVLCGSEKFPVRDPFFSMLKRSLSTFMNAFTASDWTMYPFSTQNPKDFYNLMDVYLDAAFFPKIGELNFKQEGHRLEMENNRLVYKGVVYNEMKGAMSSPGQVMGRSLLNALYPDTTYSFNSGGEPAVIPTLTYHQLKAFHQQHYHPSNAFFYTYGNLPLETHLKFIQEKILNKFEAINPNTDVPPQPRWNQPKEFVYPYPLSKNEDPAKKCQICMAWLTSDIKYSFEVLTLALLGEILLGNSASPLRKALIDSGLGSALSDGTGFEADMRDTMFACGLKDVEESAGKEIEKIIMDTLKDLAENGIDKMLIESAIHQIEFHRKEITNHPYPYGIKLMLSFSGSWFHGGDTVKILQFDEDLKRLNEALSRGPFFENQIRRYFLENPHRVLFRLVPDQLMEQKEIEQMTEELERIKAGMSPAELEKITEDAQALENLQESEEHLSVLPTLSLEDIPPLVQTLEEDTAKFEIGDWKLADGTDLLSVYEQPTSGIFYFSTAIGIQGLQKELVPMLSFFCYAFSKIGTTRGDYTEMARRIDLYTGGIGMSAHARNRYDDSGECIPFITFNGKCLVRNQDKLFDIIQELAFESDFSDTVRLKNLLLEYRAGMESMIVQNGHRLAISLASRNFSVSRTLSETWGGVHQLQMIKKLTTDLTEKKLIVIAENMAQIGKNLFTPDNIKIALVGETDVLLNAIAKSSHLLERSRQLFGGVAGDAAFAPPKTDIGVEIPREGWSTSSAVSFVARSFETVRLEHEDSPALAVISKILRSMYLHREIREKGGAYGGFAMYSSEDGLFCFASYRDPHIVNTLKVFDGALTFIRSGAYTDEDIKEAILQVCSEIDKPDPPGLSARKAFYRKLIALSDESRNRFKQQLLGLTRDQVIKAAEKYFNETGKPHAVAVISGEEKLQAANQEMAWNPLVLNRI